MLGSSARIDRLRAHSRCRSRSDDGRALRVAVVLGSSRRATRARGRASRDRSASRSGRGRTSCHGVRGGRSRAGGVRSARRPGARGTPRRARGWLRDSAGSRRCVGDRCGSRFVSSSTRLLFGVVCLTSDDSESDERVALVEGGARARRRPRRRGRPPRGGDRRLELHALDRQQEVAARSRASPSVARRRLRRPFPASAPAGARRTRHGDRPHARALEGVRSPRRDGPGRR